MVVVFFQGKLFDTTLFSISSLLIALLLLVEDLSFFNYIISKVNKLKCKSTSLMKV